MDRAEFDQKVNSSLSFYFLGELFPVGQDNEEHCLQIKEKEMLYKRYREESEAARMVCACAHVHIYFCCCCWRKHDLYWVALALHGR